MDYDERICYDFYKWCGGGVKRRGNITPESIYSNDSGDMDMPTRMKQPVQNTQD